MWIKSVAWQFAIISLMLLGVWVLNDAQRNLLWPTLGFSIGFMMELACLVLLIVQ